MIPYLQKLNKSNCFIVQYGSSVENCIFNKLFIPLVNEQIYICIYIDRYRYIDIDIHIHTYIYMYVYIHIYTHTHIQHSFFEGCSPLYLFLHPFLVKSPFLKSFPTTPTKHQNSLQQKFSCNSPSPNHFFFHSTLFFSFNLKMKERKIVDFKYFNSHLC